MKFTKLQAAYDKADDALRAAINKEFPVGCRVKVHCGRGWMFGVVVSECRYGHDVVIKSDAAAFRESVGSPTRRRSIHRKHYSSVEHA